MALNFLLPKALRPAAVYPIRSVLPRQPANRLPTPCIGGSTAIHTRSDACDGEQFRTTRKHLPIGSEIQAAPTGYAVSIPQTTLRSGAGAPRWAKTPAVLASRGRRHHAETVSAYFAGTLRTPWLPPLENQRTQTMIVVVLTMARNRTSWGQPYSARTWANGTSTDRGL